MPLLKLHMGQASTVAELARECQLDAGAMTRLLDRLEAKGLCGACAPTDDRRVVNLELTDEGRAAAEEIPAVLCRVQNALPAPASRRRVAAAQGAAAPHARQRHRRCQGDSRERQE